MKNLSFFKTNVYASVLLSVLVSANFVSFSAFGFSTFDLSTNAKHEIHQLTLNYAVKTAIQYDPWLVGNRHSQEAILSSSTAAGTMPDPKISVGIANNSAESFNFNQEEMTLFKVGISQIFPRGDSLNLKQKQLLTEASQFPFQRANRKGLVSVAVAKLWLDAYKAQESIALINQDRALFEQLADVVQASYSSAIGKTRQQDLVRAQLELTRLDDRLTMLRQKLEMSQRQLSEWLIGYEDAGLNQKISQYPSGQFSASNESPLFDYSNYRLSREMPNVKILKTEFLNENKPITLQKLFKYFSKHPSISALDKKIEASKNGISLAKQKYKPEFGFAADYGARGTAPNGVDRSDLFSISVSFDIPLFTTNRQDKQVQSAIAKTSAIKAEKWVLIRKLIASYETSRSQLARLEQRQALYREKLLPQMHDQAEASLTAYTNDDGNFSEVVRSRIAELNARIDFLSINVERQKTIVQINYFFMQDAKQIIPNSSDLADFSNSFGEKNDK